MSKFTTCKCPNCKQEVRSRHGKFNTHYLPKEMQKKTGMKVCPESDQTIVKPAFHVTSPVATASMADIMAGEMENVVAEEEENNG